MSDELELIEEPVTPVVETPEAEDDPFARVSSLKDRCKGKNKYIRKALVYVGRLSPQAFKVYKARNMWEAAAMNLVRRASEGTKADSIAAYKEIKESLGERLGSDRKDFIENHADAVSVKLSLPQ